MEEFKPLFNDCFSDYSFSSEETKDYDVGWKKLAEDAKPLRRRRSISEQFSFVGEDAVLLEYGNSAHLRHRRAVEPVYTSTSGRQQRKRKGRGGQSKAYYVLESALLPDGSIISCPTRWVYHDMMDLRGYPFWGRLTVYSGGGYPADLGYDYPTAMTVIADLHSHNWVDKQTRSVFVEFTVYNANVNLFGIAFLFIEFLPTGGAIPYGQFSVSRLYNYIGSYSNFLLALEVVVILFMIYFMYREGKKVYKQGKRYFKGFWNWLEVAMIVLEFLSSVLFFARLWEVDKNLIELHHNPKDFVSFQYAGAADEALSYVVGLLVFLVNLRFIKLLRFNKRMALLGNTIGNIAKPLAMFMISFSIVFVAFAVLGSLVFGIESENFRSFVASIETQLSIVLGDFDYAEMEQINRVLGPAYFFGFMYFVVMYLMNMFMAIINGCYAEAKEDNDKQENEYEMVDFILQKFKDYLGIQSAPILSKSRPSTGFPSSPPFRPSDYRHHSDSDTGNESDSGSFMMNNPFMVMRELSILSNEIDQFETRLEENNWEHLENDKMLVLAALQVIQRGGQALPN